MNIKQTLSDLFWKIVLPFFRIKWWFSNRGESKSFRERQKWEYLIHGYKSCIYYSGGQCKRKWQDSAGWSLRFLWDDSWACDKSIKCKRYFYNPLKDSE